MHPRLECIGLGATASSFWPPRRCRLAPRSRSPGLAQRRHGCQPTSLSGFLTRLRATQKLAAFWPGPAAFCTPAHFSSYCVRPPRAAIPLPSARSARLLLLHSLSSDPRRSSKLGAPGLRAPSLHISKTLPTCRFAYCDNGCLECKQRRIAARGEGAHDSCTLHVLGGSAWLCATRRADRDNLIYTTTFAGFFNGARLHRTALHCNFPLAVTHLTHLDRRDFWTLTENMACPCPGTRR